MANFKTNTDAAFRRQMQDAFEMLENTPLAPDKMAAAIARLKKSAAHYPPTSADLIQVLAQYERDVAELKSQLSVRPRRRRSASM